MNAININSRVAFPRECDQMARVLGDEKYVFGNYFGDFGGLYGREWAEFASTWDDLGEDHFMADEGTYRERRFSLATYDARFSHLTYDKHVGYFQESTDNPLNGGVDRVFEPITPFIACHGILRDLIGHYSSMFKTLGFGSVWDLQLHQVRINTTRKELGQPSPEGIHKDGTNFTTLVMIKREGIVGGENKLFDNEKHLIASKTLLKEGDLVILNDKELYHDVSSIEPEEESGYRDMLMIGFTQSTSNS